jgi:alkanesulfonate monooxygenase SsuD/methylene tetrahydromethanopterin reductase-like flavin-dependent oxidoreductase (luciferase family)
MHARQLRTFPGIHEFSYPRTAAQLGFGTLSVNDHLVFSVSWLDGPVALAAVMEHSEKMTLATTVALAVVCGPVPVATTLAAVDRLSGGRLLVAVGSGSSPEDYAAVGLDFTEGWQRFDEVIGALRVVAAGRCAVRRPLLLDRGSRRGTSAGATARTTDLGG